MDGTKKKSELKSEFEKFWLTLSETQQALFWCSLHNHDEIYNEFLNRLTREQLDKWGKCVFGVGGKGK